MRTRSCAAGPAPLSLNLRATPRLPAPPFTSPTALQYPCVLPNTFFTALVCAPLQLSFPFQKAAAAQRGMGVIRTDL